jgi:hypothetical protein
MTKCFPATRMPCQSIESPSCLKATSRLLFAQMVQIDLTELEAFVGRFQCEYDQKRPDWGNRSPNQNAP